MIHIFTVKIEFVLKYSNFPAVSAVLCGVSVGLVVSNYTILTFLQNWFSHYISTLVTVTSLVAVNFIRSTKTFRCV